MDRQKITIEATVRVPATKAWSFYTEPEHIVKWNSASDDWHTTRAENDLRKGGKFLSRMEAKDGSFGFDFGGVYDEVKINELITYSLDDRRKVQIDFASQGNECNIAIAFEAETENPVEMQKVVASHSG